jgi:RNA polymerase sigma-70 factor (ECF subfamily)
MSDERFDDHERQADSQLTSLSLLERARAQEADAWTRLVDLYSPLVRFWCTRAGLRPDDASDVMQDVFRSLAGNLANFRRERTGDTFRGWLWTITRNKIRDHFRTQRSRPDATGGSEAQQWLQEVPDPLAALSEDATGDVPEWKQLFRRALELIRGEFEPRTWQAFWRATVEGHDTGTIAEELGMTGNAVRKAKSRVLHRLRSELGDLIE